MDDTESILRAAAALHALSDPHVAADGICSLIANALPGHCVALVARCQRSNDLLDIIADSPAGVMPPAQAMAIPVHRGRSQIVLHLWRTDGDPSTPPSWLTPLVEAMTPLLERLERTPHRPTVSIDPETGFWTRREFMDQIDRRFNRLDIERQYAVLMVFGWCRDDDRPEANAAVVRASADRMRDMLRPSDVMGRLAPHRLAAWCDNMDHLVGAERATRIATALQAPLLGTGRYCLVSIAARQPDAATTVAKMIDTASAGLTAARQIALDSQDIVVRIAGVEAAIDSAAA